MRMAATSSDLVEISPNVDPRVLQDYRTISSPFDKKKKKKEMKAKSKVSGIEGNPLLRPIRTTTTLTSKAKHAESFQGRE